MLTIVGSGMGEYDFSNIELEFCKYDKIICDKNFKDSGGNILKLSYKDAKEYILSHYEDEELLYIVSGSPFFYSAGIIIAKQLPRQKVIMIDNTSSKSYMLRKLFVSEADVGVVSLHGRSRLDLSEFLQKRWTFVLCDKDSIKRLKEYLKWIENDNLTIMIGYKLGYKDEVIKQIDLNCDEFDLTKPYVLMIKREYELSQISFDDEFVTERGMITKKLKRDIALQSLELLPNQILWDIGSGSGSCAIEAYKRYKVKTYLFEKQPQRVEFIKQNLKTHKVVDATLLEGSAEKMWDDVKQMPDRIFVGGGGSDVMKQIPKLYNKLKTSGIMIVNLITLKNLTELLQVLNKASISYQFKSFSITTYKGKLDMVEPQRQLFVVEVRKD